MGIQTVIFVLLAAIAAMGILWHAERKEHKAIRETWLGTIEAQAKALKALEQQLGDAVNARDILATEKAISQKRDKAGQTYVPTDWETIQAHYAANPDNFKEQN
jgi:hypothetical protein